MMYVPCQENQYHPEVHRHGIFEVRAMIGLELVYLSFLSLHCTYIFPLKCMHILLYEVPPTGTVFVSQNTCGILYLLAAV